MADWIVRFIEETGYAGVALLMFLENVFPPIPSEIIMPFAGFAAARGELHVLGTILSGTAGAVAGATLWYLFGRWAGGARLHGWVARHGRWLTLTPEQLKTAEEWFRRHGRKAVFLGRLLPALRTLISVPAGVSGMRLLPFLLWTAAGSLLWTGALTLTGVLLGARYESVSQYVNWIANVVIAVLVLGYAWRQLTWGRRR
jgi:membrane protein DedA with SNARE-associated domain